MKHERFHDPRLRPQENKAVEMLRNGFSRAAIMDELDIDRKHLSTLFYRARKLGVDVPKVSSGPQSCAPPDGSIPIQKLVALRAQLERAGFKYAGMFRVMSERTGLSENCIKVRLWKYDHGLKPKYAEGHSA